LGRWEHRGRSGADRPSSDRGITEKDLGRCKDEGKKGSRKKGKSAGRWYRKTAKGEEESRDGTMRILLRTATAKGGIGTQNKKHQAKGVENTGERERWGSARRGTRG